LSGQRKRNNGNGGSPYEAAWTEAAHLVSLAGLKGLTAQCPVCGAMGALMSKWVPKTPVKPLYVVHANGGGSPGLCELNKEQADAARAEIGITSRDVLKVLRMGKPFVMFSGGQDSLCLLEYMRRLGERAGLEITAIHANTTAGFPEVEDYVEAVCEQLGVALVTVKPDHDYFEIAKRWGIPGVRSRWCCETLKIAPMRRHLATVEGPKVIYDGIRAVESPLRAKYVPVWFHPAFRCISVSPIHGWPDGKVARYIKSNGLPESPAAQLGTSAECWCGAYKCRSDFEALLDIHPDIFDKLVEVEEAQRGKYTYLYEKGERIPLASLRQECEE